MCRRICRAHPSKGIQHGESHETCANLDAHSQSHKKNCSNTLASYNKISAANDCGPKRIEDIIDIEFIADRLGLTEYELIEFCRRHEQTMQILMHQSALEMVEEIGYREGLLTLTDEDPPPIGDLDSYDN